MPRKKEFSRVFKFCLDEQLYQELKSTAATLDTDVAVLVRLGAKYAAKKARERKEL